MKYLNLERFIQYNSINTKMPTLIYLSELMNVKDTDIYNLLYRNAKIKIIFCEKR
jgi:succinate dehydrogenase flavin-adding protein (antitoxin of CptAB toxin-antitoxin module)